jgi:transcriptional regulator with XRE-family HTH domain
VMCFHFDIGSRARHAGRFIGRVRGELLRALSERKAETGLSQQALARKLDADRAQINRQLSGEASLSLRSLADLAWAMDMEISFELKKPAASAGQNQPMTTSTVRHGQIKYINGGTRKISVVAAPANSELGQAKKSA